MKKSDSHSIKDKFKSFFHADATGGIVLMIAAAIAIIMTNSRFADNYYAFLHINIPGDPVDFFFAKTAHHWINDGLMAIFFFFVGLEIKREIVMGSLSTRASAMLPVIAAVGGMLVPALVYIVINRHVPQNFHGWAIPSATDIAFALGIFSLLGNRVPVSLKMLLMAIAVIDDLGAVIIIAFFYTADLSAAALFLAACFTGCLYLLHKMKIRKIWPYIVAGILLWCAVLESGVHATLAGVITALFIPRDKIDDIAHKLHPYVTVGIMPLFGFANAGVSLEGISVDYLLQPLPLGVAAGLFFGKQAGIFAALFAAIKSGRCPMPKDATWLQLYGLSLLCGIGFTMSLFIGSLAFESAEVMQGVTIGVLFGSLLSAVAGFIVLKLAIRRA